MIESVIIILKCLPKDYIKRWELCLVWDQCYKSGKSVKNFITDWKTIKDCFGFENKQTNLIFLLICHQITSTQYSCYPIEYPSVGQQPGRVIHIVRQYPRVADTGEKKTNLTDSGNKRCLLFYCHLVRYPFTFESLSWLFIESCGT